MTSNILWLSLIVSAAFFCHGMPNQPLYPAHWETKASEEVKGAVNEWFGAGNVEYLQPEQVHLSYWGNPQEMWVTWVSWKCNDSHYSMSMGSAGQKY